VAGGQRGGRVTARAAVLLAAAVAPVALVASSAPTAAAERPVDRVLILSLPTLSWADLQGAHVPHLRHLLDGSAVASLSVRSVHRATTAGDAYATIGAGQRATGLPGLDGLAFDPGEAHAGGPATDAFVRGQGAPPGPGPFVLAAGRLRAGNASGPYEASVGALGRALAGAGIDRAVAANADLGPAPDDPGLGRQAALALATPRGRVPAGAVGSWLREPDGGAPYGVRLSRAAVAAAFRGAWRRDSVVLVEGSDLARLDAERALLTPERAAALLRQQLTHLDALVGRLLADVHPRRDAVLVLGPYHRADRPHLTVFGLRAPGLRPGLLESPTTRRAGYVSLVDVGPTVLDLLDVGVPAAMAGGPVHVARGGGSPGHRGAALVAADEAARFRDRMLGPVTVAAVGVVAAVLLVGALALRGKGWARPVAEVGALAAVAFLPATYLAGALPFHRWGAAAYWGFLVAASVGPASAAVALGRRLAGSALPIVLGAAAGVLVVDALRGAPLQLSTVFGYSPVQGGRFAGLPNVAFAQLAAAAVLLAGLVARRVGGRRGALAAAAVLVAVVVVDGMPMWGADVGGVLSLVPTTGIVVALLLRVRVRIRTAALWLGAGVVAMVGVGLLDLARPAGSRTHLGRLFAAVHDQGWTALTTVVERKLAANVAALTNTPWLLMVPVVALFALWVARHAPGTARQVWEQGPELRAALIGLAVVAVLGLGLNDSGVAVPGAMAVVACGALTHLAVTAAPAR